MCIHEVRMFERTTYILRHPFTIIIRCTHSYCHMLNEKKNQMNMRDYQLNKRERQTDRERETDRVTD